ncbi:hypothetical protein H1Z61_00975 [Bacillus aquiflavi]|uniref:ATPase n=1 Tax=Bacillus aquiflavi TaxID=2672567 RepID=A0A6B3VUV5_9BACI|nr:PRK06851 family protein [Bacillus aquiflavi]MBA4535741.1 hypothetical protein [Bacillus aquiflavi]NEY80117.1 hypothetical protein [Bacillus aquiflavi]
MKGQILKYFSGGNTAYGFYNLFESSLSGLNRLFILKGGPGTGKSSLMKKIGKKWVEKGYDIEYIFCSSDSDSIDGVIITKLKIGIVDGTAPHVIEPKAPGAIEEYVNLGVAWDSAKLVLKKDEILALRSEVNQAFQCAYNKFAQALKIHDQWEKIYIQNMDFSKANKLTNELIKKIFGKKKKEQKSEIKHRFLGAATPNGPINFIENITEHVPKRYFIKGRAGSGKSTMLKKLVTSAEERGYDVEVYRCGFDPNSLDMVVFRELGVSVFDSTAPHECFPSRVGDEIIDMYKETIWEGTDEKYAKQIEQISEKYKAKMKEGTCFLAKAKQLRDQLEQIYIGAMDFSIVEQIRNELDTKISQHAEKVYLI